MATTSTSTLATLVPMTPEQQRLSEPARNCVRELRRLLDGTWNADSVSALQDALERLSDHAANLDVATVHAAALDLYAYLAPYDGALTPKAAQLAGLERLTNSLESALGAADEGARGGQYIDLLMVGEQPAAALVPALVERGYRCRVFDDGDDWVTQLREALPVAVITAADVAQATIELLDQQVRAHGQLSAVLLIALGGAEERLEALMSGADWFVDRLDDPGLAAQISEWIEARDTEPYRVLVIDDDRDMRLYCSTILQRAGMQVEDLADPDRALEVVARFKPDLVLVDLYMPKVDGITVTARLRADDSTTLLPIVFISGEMRDSARIQALRVGGDDFLTKPVQPRALLAAVRSRIKRARTLNRKLVAKSEARGGQLRRGDFLAELERVQAAGRGWRVLVAMRVDQHEGLRERLGLAGAHELEQAIGLRLREVLGSADRFALWEEFGFGLVLERGQREEIEQTVAALLKSVHDRPFRVRNQDTALTLSAGLAMPPRASKDASVDRWIASAFAALSMAVRLGGKRVEGVLSMDPSVLPPERLLVIRQALKELTRGTGLRIEFQPMLRLRGDRGHYSLSAPLRDARAPLSGIPRSEYLELAREHDALATIDRMSLFRAFEAIDELRTNNRSSRVLVPLDLAATNSRQVAWLEAELRRRPADSAALIVEIETALIVERPALRAILRRLKDCGIALAAVDRSGGLVALEALAELPIDLLRVPHRAIQQAPPEQVSAVLSQWRGMGRELLVDEIEDVRAVTGLWNLGIDYLQGDALAASSPRLDFDFGDIAL